MSYVSNRFKEYKYLTPDACDAMLVVTIYSDKGECSRIIAMKLYGEMFTPNEDMEESFYKVGKIFADNIRDINEPSIPDGTGADLDPNDFVGLRVNVVLDILNEYAKNNNREISINECS